MLCRSLSRGDWLLNIMRSCIADSTQPLARIIVDISTVEAGWKSKKPEKLTEKLFFTAFK